VALLHQGRLARLGPPDQVITRETLREVYGVEVTVMEVARVNGGVARVCVPALGAPRRGMLLEH
jgi:iron complex transport system ATP-binding protein